MRRDLTRGLVLCAFFLLPRASPAVAEEAGQANEDAAPMSSAQDSSQWNDGNTPSEEELRAAFEREQDQFREILRFDMKIIHGAIGEADLGANGQLVFVNPAQMFAMGDHGCVVYVVREPEGLALYRWGEYPDLHVYARVDNAGRYRVVEAAQHPAMTAASPEEWPYRNQEGHPTFPHQQGYLCHPSIEAKWEPRRPAEAIGWVYQSASGDFICPAPAVEPFPGTIWVVPKGNGIQFVHGGPLSSGVVAEVTGKCEISFYQGSEQRGSPCEAAHLWRRVDHRGWPVLPRQPFSLKASLATFPCIVYPDGSEKRLEEPIRSPRSGPPHGAM